MLQRSWHCSHSPQERTLTGVWCSPELVKAVEKGYCVMYIYEVWHFPQTSTTLFQPYIDTFLKIKQESSDWPKDCNTPEARQAYIRDYLLHEGIQLDPNKVEDNPGLRKLAKLKLNNFWGKYGQRTNQTKVTTCSQPHEFFELLQDDSQIIHRIEIVNDDMVEVFHTYENECIPTRTNVNIFIACFTTCHARLKLYGALEMLEQRVLYFETDSIIYTWKPGQSHVPLGNYLGDFTSELAKDDYITEFVAAGPKNYAYVTKKGKGDCKVRGFTLNTRGQQHLNFNTMKDLILAEILEPEPEPRTITLTDPHKIQRVAKNKTIQTVSQAKKYKLVFDKRVLDVNTFQSFPYGYQHI